jgi:hypothetical protein
MIYGYGIKQVDQCGLLEMREITLAASPEVLRDVARFLSDMADLMESGAFANCSHRHIGSVILDWEKRFPGKDVIVMPPATVDDGEG